jgi:hypothetical protein
MKTRIKNQNLRRIKMSDEKASVTSADLEDVLGYCDLENRSAAERPFEASK